MSQRLQHSEQLSYKSVFIGVPDATGPGAHPNQPSGTARSRGKGPLAPGKAAHNQPDLVKRCSRWLSEIIYSR